MSTVGFTARLARIRAGENPSLAGLTPGHRGASNINRST